MLQFKKDIQTKIEALGLLEIAETGELLQYIYDYSPLVIGKADFQKRKRIKNHVPLSYRCSAKRANGEQCTRRKRVGGEFCGTHVKGTPHGIFENVDSDSVNIENIEIWVQEIKGIFYYIDENGNIYDHEDVLTNNSKMDVIAKYVVDAAGNYTIPELGI